MKGNPAADSHPFFADRPIETRSEDRLGRAQFADALAGAIGGWRERDSLVIGLYGGWGSGKTSIKNMALEALHASSSNVHSVEFNPWEWSSQDRLFESFFREIGAAVGEQPGGDSQRLRRWAEKWQEYGAYLQAGASVADGLRRLLTIVVVVLAAGWLLPLLGISSLAPLYLPVALVLLGFAAFLGWGGRFANQVAEAILISSNRRIRATPDIKNNLRDAFKQARNTILVIIDDIDRLPADQILSVFQLVKANADFPGVVYLLLFDRPAVEAALQSSRTVTSDFIEKIVQVGFDVPLAEQQSLEGVLFDELDKMLAALNASEGFQQDRWNDLFLEGLRPYFQTMRQVRRYASSLSFHLALLARTGTLEVNFVDLIGLEVLRVFEAPLYRELPRAKAVLTGQDPLHGLGGERADQQDKIAIERLLNLAPEDRRSAAEAILQKLFPTIGRLTSQLAGDVGGRDRWVREARISSPEFFGRYFQLQVPEDDISRHELDNILSIANSRKELVRKFAELRDRGLLDVALDRLDAYKQVIDRKHVIPFLTALFDIGDWFTDEQPAFFAISPMTHASRIIYWYLRQDPDPASRGKSIFEAAEQTKGLRLVVEIVSNDASRHQKGNTQEYPDG